MELLIKHGANTWLAHNRSIEAAVKQCALSLLRNLQQAFSQHRCFHPTRRNPSTARGGFLCFPALHPPSTFIRMVKDIAAVKKEVEELNKTRKMQQTAAGAEISRLNRDWFAIVEKNKEIEAACKELEGQIRALGGQPPEGAPAGEGDVEMTD